MSAATWSEVWITEDGNVEKKVRGSHFNNPARFERQSGWERVVDLPSLVVHQWVKPKLSNRKTVMWIINVPE